MAYEKWFNNIEDGDKIELYERDYLSSLGVYNVKKNTENNTVNFTRNIPVYNNWGYEYDEKNNLTIDSRKIKNYNYSDPIKPSNNIQSYNTWYDNIDENKMYTLKNNNLIGLPLKGNYHVKKRDGKVLFTRHTSIMRKYGESDENNSICISEYGTGPRDYKCVPYSEDNYKYYSKSTDIALAEEDALYSTLKNWW